MDLYIKPEHIVKLTLTDKEAMCYKHSSAVQSQKAVSAYFTIKQILPFGFAEQSSPPLPYFWIHIFERQCYIIVYNEKYKALINNSLIRFIIIAWCAYLKFPCYLRTHLHIYLYIGSFWQLVLFKMKELIIVMFQTHLLSVLLMFWTTLTRKTSHGESSLKSEIYCYFDQS